MANLNELLAVEKSDATQRGLDKTKLAVLPAGIKGDTPSEKGLHRQLVDNNTARDNLEELLIEVNNTKEDTDANTAKFNTARKLKLKQLLRAALKANYEQKMFLQLARESGYEAVEAFRSSEMDNKAMDINMKKKLEDIRKQYGRKEQPRAPYRQSPKKGDYPRRQLKGYYPNGYEPAGQMNEIHLQGQAAMFGQGQMIIAGPGQDVPAANGNVRPGANGIPRQGRLQHHGKVRAKVPRRKGEAGHRQVKEHVQCLPEVWALGWGRGLPAERGQLPRAAATRGREVKGSEEFLDRIFQKFKIGNVFWKR